MAERVEYVFSCLEERTVEKNRISSQYEEDKWKIVDYEAGDYKGKMLITPESGYPQNLTLELNVEGTYQIYICIPKFRSENYLYIKLSDDLCFTGVRATSARPRDWGTEGFFEEIYWKTAELTGKSIVIGKPESTFRSVTGLAWIRCVPVDDSVDVEKMENKCLQMHIDEDALSEDRFETDDDYLIKLYQMKNTNAEFVSFEFSFDYDKTPDSNIPHLLEQDKRWDMGHYSFAPQKERIYPKIVEFAHNNDMEIYATNRMEVGNFILPYTRRGWNINFVDEHPEYYLKNRNGTTVKICSYAYDEVQEYVIKNFVDMLKYGFDGISLILHRGTFLGFEKPVVDRFKELYPDINPCVLPFMDDRLNGVWRSFMNEFMKKLRDAMDRNSDRHIKINVITDYSPETSKSIGLDVEYWAKNGFIDSVSQADMEIVEELDGCMSDETPEYIDLDKFNREIRKRKVVNRYYLTNVDKICKNIPKYRQLKDLYGTEVYHVLPWVHSIQPDEYDAIVEKMKKAGAEKFLSWNTNHLVWDLPEWYVVSRIGNIRNDEIIKRSFLRVISIDGCDTSQFNPNWRG